MGSGLLYRGGTQRVRCLSPNADPGNHRWKAPRRLTLDTNESLATAWTADSKAVLFVSDRNGTWKLFKQNIDETTAEVLVEGRSMRFPRLSADGSQVLYLVESQRGDHSFPASLMSKPLAGGPPRLVLQENGITNYQCARAPSQLCIFSKLVGVRPHSCLVRSGARCEVARLREFRMAYLTGAFPRMDRGLHSSWTRIEFDFSHRTPAPFTMLA